MSVERIGGMSAPDYALAVVVAAARGDGTGVDALLQGLTGRQSQTLARALVVVLASFAHDAAASAGVDVESFITGMASVIGEGDPR